MKRKGTITIFSYDLKSRGEFGQITNNITISQKK